MYLKRHPNESLLLAVDVVWCRVPAATAGKLPTSASKPEKMARVRAAEQAQSAEKLCECAEVA